MPAPELPYASFSYYGTHPDRLSTFAKLFGLTPAPSDACRVLELGCASGGNLLPMAAEFPASQFVGIDLSPGEIARGTRLAAELGLTNVRFIAADVTAISAEIGTFDYVIAHGLFSWVPEPVRAHILQLTKAVLAPHGVAYIGYNALPGWHTKRIAMDLVRRFGGTPSDASAEHRVAVARGVLEVFKETLPESDLPYSRTLHADLDQAMNTDDSYIEQEYLAPTNDAFYFGDFVRMARGVGLNWLSDSMGLNARVTGAFHPQVRAVLDEVSTEWTEVEEYLDFITSRTHRLTLLVHDDVRQDDNVHDGRIQSFLIAGHFRAADGEPVQAPGLTTFTSAWGPTAVLADPAIKCAMATLGDAWPRRLKWDDLIAAVEGRLGRGLDDQSRQRLALQLMVCFGTNLLELHVRPHLGPPLVALRPTANPVARALAREGAPRVPAAPHRCPQINSFERSLILLLDGTRDLAGLIDGMVTAVRDGAFALQHGGRQLTTDDELRVFLAARLPGALDGFAQAGLLIHP